MNTSIKLRISKTSPQLFSSLIVLCLQFSPVVALAFQTTAERISANLFFDEHIVYDGKGRVRVRVEYDGDKFQDSWTTNAVVRYVYDGMRVIQERTIANTPTVSYTRGSDLSGSLEGAGGIGGLLGRTAHSGTGGTNLTHAVYSADGNGNVTYLLNSSQSKAAAYRYDPFGNHISSSGDLGAVNVYRFSSKEIHVNSGLYYYGYRFYHPNLQRWLNRDPIGVNGGVNLYEFVGNSPLHSFDALGLMLWYCTTPTTMVGGIGRHGYVWNDDPASAGDAEDQYGQYCGQERCLGFIKSGTPTRNGGPTRGDTSGTGTYGDVGWKGTQKSPDTRDIECVPLPGTEDDQRNRDFMNSCRSGIDELPWTGPAWDCHTSAGVCLRRDPRNLEMPPFRRWNSQPPIYVPPGTFPPVPPPSNPPVTLPPNYRAN